MRRKSGRDNRKLDCPKRISDYSPIPAQFDMTHSSANDIAALPPGVKLTTLDNGLVIIVRRSPLLQFGAVVELQP